MLKPRKLRAELIRRYCSQAVKYNLHALYKLTERDSAKNR